MWWRKKSLPVQAGDCFNEYQNWFSFLPLCNDSIDITTKVRIRAFGKESDKQNAWDKDWRSKHPAWGTAAAGVSVSSKIPEIWCGLRKTKKGLVLPMGILAHEMLHTLKLKDGNIINPDLLIDIDTY